MQTYNQGSVPVASSMRKVATTAIITATANGKPLNQVV